MAKSKNSKDVSDKDKAPDAADTPETETGAPADVTRRVVVDQDTPASDTSEGAPPDVTRRVIVTDQMLAQDADAPPVVQEEPLGATGTESVAMGDDSIAPQDDTAPADKDAAPADEPSGSDTDSPAAEPLFPPDPAVAHEDTTASASASVPPQVVRETVVQKRGGFFPVLIGGVLAAGAGFLAAQYESNDWPFAAAGDDPFQAETQASLDAQQSAVDALTNRVGAVETSVGGIDMAGLQASVSDLDGRIDDVAGQVSELSDRLGLMEVRVVELEKAPMAESVSPEAIAAYERELDALRADVAQQRTEIETMAADAMAAEENASAQAELAKARAALAEVTAAIDAGAPFSDAITDISEADTVAVPEALRAVSEDGVPSLNALIAEFPEVARDGLAAARAAGADAESGNRVVSFFRDQLGARSVTPREGEDPDAVLSRAEAAVKAGDLSAALAEIETLPEVAREAMSGWIAKAQTRVQAQAAAMSLSQELNKQ